MDLLLTHGYFLDEDRREREIMRPYPPLGLLHLSAWLKRAGFAVEVVDSTFQTFDQVATRIREARAPVVGIYGNLMTRRNVVRLSRVAADAGSHVVLGGPEPANYAEEFLARGAHAIVSGEGEVTLEALLPALRARGPHRLHGIPGAIFRDESGAVVRNDARAVVKNLDDFPDPDREAIDQARYVETWRTHHGAGSISLITARGCPFTCTWCSHEVYGRTHRRRSVSRVVAEIARLRERYRPDQLWFADDVFTVGHGWLYQFAEAMKSAGMRIPFECISRADRINVEVADALASLGCRRLWIGSESGSQRVLDAMRRGVTVEQVRAAIELLRARRIEVGMFLMWGYEGEEWSDVESTIAHVERTLPDEFLTTIAYPIKGTAYHDLARDRLVVSEDWEGSSDREIRVTGRFSRRFYSLADRRLRARVAAARSRGGRAWLARAKHWSQAELYRIAMLCARGRGTA